MRSIPQASYSFRSDTANQSCALPYPCVLR